MIVGGAQENTLLSVKGHLEHGYECALVTGPTTGPEGKLLDEVKVPDLRVIIDSNLCREINPVFDFSAYFSLKKLFVSENFDIVHTHSSKAGVIARLAADHARIPVVVHTVHGPSFHDYQSGWINYLYILAEKFAARYSVRMYTVANAMSTLYLNQKIGKDIDYKTVYSGMDLEPFLQSEKDSDLAEKLGIDLTRPVIGKVARLFKLKGYDYLLKAAQLIVKEIPDVQFLIVGDGILKDSICNHVKEMNLTDNFIFAGLVDPKVIHNYIALMDILVHLSLREGLPRSVVQALASGKPAVGFDLDGTPEVIINNKTGYICNPGDFKQVADSVTKLLKAPDDIKNMGDFGREFVQKRWDWRIMVSQLEQDYKKLLIESKEKN